MLVSVTPFFIVDDLTATLDFYQSKLGFNVPYEGGGDGEVEEYWAFVGRDPELKGERGKAAEILRVSRTTLYRKMKQYRID